ncbi:MAG: translocation/assembly module TamB domain-containing protein [gamma proteobacterium symbiont of Bathyaustriella thionipta]|nr:translocation/assembly module TamB domain-containing protein [gamma proteobacterium symbiont of Bathyaustriella thionipta]
MKTVITALKNGLKFSLGLVFIVLCISFILVGTDRGFHFLINSLQEITSEQIQFSQVKGNLLGQLDIVDFKYTDPTIKISIKKFHLDWQAEQLLTKKLTINNITASGIVIKPLQDAAIHKTPNPSITQNITPTLNKLPEINLPVSVFFKQLQLTDIKFVPAADIRASIINTMQLKADIVDNQFQLHQLSFTMPEAQANIHGSAQLQKNYPVNLHSSVTLHLPEQADLMLKGNIKGDLIKLQISQYSSGLLNASINAQVFQLLNNINWNTDIQLKQLPLALLIPENNESLNIQITGHGDLNQANIVVKTNAVTTSSNNIASSNTLNKINMLELEGLISWHDTIKWQASLLTRQLNPGIIHKDWPGSLNIKIQSNGQLSDDHYKAAIKLNTLTGRLRKKALMGKGQFTIDNTVITITQLNLSSGEANLKINGQLAEHINLDWTLAINQFSDILPQAQGRINGNGSLNGTAQHPVLEAALTLNNVIYENVHLKNTDLICLLNSNPEIPSDINLNAQQFEFDGQHLDNLKLTLTGPLKKHHINITAEHKQASLTLSAQGQFDQQQRIWDGIIEHSVIESKKLGQWTQNNTTTLLAGTQKILLSPLCLQSILQKKVSTLCAQIDWKSEQGKAKLSLGNLPFQHFQTYLPDEMTHFSGALDLTAAIDLTPQLQAYVKAEIQSGELIYQPIGQQAIKLKHKNGLIKANYNSQQLDAKWHMEMGPHNIKGSLNIPRREIENDLLNATVTGTMSTEIKDLQILTLLVPQLTDIDGHLSANLKLEGRLGTPEITGQADFIANYLSIRDLGIRIEDIAISMKDSNAGQELALQGSLHSGKGQLQINGLFSLDDEQGWPLTLDVQGSDFQALNIPDAYIILSPDIQFSQQRGLMNITGHIRVPEAAITPAAIPEGSISISPDVQVTGTEQKIPTNLALDISLALGDKITLDAFGLKSHLAGELSVTKKAKQLMTGNGELHLTNGTFRAYGQDLTIDKGNIFYTGGALDNPGLKLTASRKVSDTQVGIKVSGSAKKPTISTFSDDASLETKDIISMMLTGQKIDNLDNAKIYAGHEINKDLSVGVNAGIGDEGSEFITRYKLTDKIQLEGTSSTTKSGGSILYTFEVE